MKSNILMGIWYLLRGFTLIFKPGLRIFVILPLVINTFVFALMIWFFAGGFNRVIEWILPDSFTWLNWLLWPLFAISIILVAFYTFSIGANLVGAPFNGLLAGRVELWLTGKNAAVEWVGIRGIMKEMTLTLLNELKKFCYFIFWTCLFMTLFFIPAINMAAPILWGIFSAWMLALEYLDYPISNHGLSFSELRRMLAEKKFMALGFGGATLLLTMIPFINFITMPIAVIGATIMWVEEWGIKRLGDK